MWLALVQVGRRPGEPYGSGGAAPQRDPGELGMWLFLGTLGILFAASLLVYFLLRVFQPHVPRLGGLPPGGVLLSTGVLLASSGTMHQALRAARRGRWRRLRPWLALTALLGLVFLGSQVRNWRLMLAAGMPLERNVGAYLYLVLPGLHAAHVLGGLIPLLVLTVQSLRAGAASAGRSLRPARLAYCAMYWHFLDVVWLVMAGVILLGI